MKKALMLSLLSLTAISAFAQNTSKITPYAKLNRKAINFFLNQQTQSVAAKTTTVKERMRSEADYDNTVSPAAIQDSGLFVYSNGRGSTFDYNFMYFNANNRYTQGGPLYAFENSAIPTQAVLFDTAYLWSIDATTNLFGSYEIATQGINASNGVTRFRDAYTDSATNQNTDQYITYDGTGKIKAMYYFNTTSGVYDSTYKRLFTYNSSGLLATDSTYLYNGSGWDLNEKVVYTRDASGNITHIDDYTYSGSSTGWALQQQYISAYDASNRLTAIQVNYYVGYYSAVIPVAKDTFTYTGSAPFFTSYIAHQALTDSTLQPYQYQTKHLNASGLPDTTIDYTFVSSWVPQSKSVYTYNSYNDPVKMMQYPYSGGAYATTPSASAFWYYEQYFPAAVEKLATSGNVKLYPNPTTGNITISGIDLAENTPLNISVLSITGQMLSTLNTHWNGQSQALNISSLAPGSYFVLVSGANGNVLHRQSIVKE